MTVSRSSRPSHDVLALDVGHLLVPEDGDLGVLQGPLLHDLAASELVATVDHHDLGRVARQEGGLFQRRVAAAHHGDLLASEEEAVAGGAGADTPRPRRRVSFSSPSHSALAPVATMTESAVYSTPSAQRWKGRAERSTRSRSTSTIARPEALRLARGRGP